MKVAIGPVFDEFGGVSQHILGINKYSAYNISVLPSKITRTVLAPKLCSKYFEDPWYLIRYYQRLMDTMRLKGYDVIHSHANVWFTNLCQMSKTYKCKWVHTYHTLYFEEDYPDGLSQAAKIQNNFLINVASKADVKISISKWLHDFLYEKYSIQTVIIPNGVDFNSCNNANPDRFFKKYGLKDFIIFIGYMDHVKNPRPFIEMAIRMPDARFVMIGRNLDRNNIRLNYGIIIPENITIINEMNHKDILDAIAACKAFVMTSKREGIPTALLEAMAIGKPVVVPDHTGCKEVVHNEQYGFLYEPDSLSDLIEKTNLAILSKNIGKNAQERVLSNYDWRIVAQKIDAVYED